MPKTNTVTNDTDRRMLIVKFKDGTSVELPWDLLRDACPCAECRQAHGPRDPLQLMAAPDTNLVAYEYAGNYAVQLTWGDGHRFGIYTWPYLRELAERMKRMRDEG